MEIQKTAKPLSVIDESKRDGVPGHRVAQSLEDMLAEYPFFKGMKAEHLSIVARAATRAKFDAGQVIFREGDPANRLYLIQHGKVALEAQGTGTTGAEFQIIGAGDVLGWSWLFPPFNSHFRARALEPTQCIFLYGSRLREECEQNHELGYELMKRTVGIVIQRLQATRERLVEISTLKDVGATNGEFLATGSAGSSSS